MELSPHYFELCNCLPNQQLVTPSRIAAQAALTMMPDRFPPLPAARKRAACRAYLEDQWRSFGLWDTYDAVMVDTDGQPIRAVYAFRLKLTFPPSLFEPEAWSDIQRLETLWHTAPEQLRDPGTDTVVHWAGDSLEDEGPIQGAPLRHAGAWLRRRLKPMLLPLGAAAALLTGALFLRPVHQPEPLPELVKLRQTAPSATPTEARAFKTQTALEQWNPLAPD